ncbi:2Fe-2S iron-sulfur cluster-binding protein [Pelomonas sp. KK5]|uniref:2Fe-2S iron-sulfur cluster-binding protein n=1 Tax=Pelomonas sp. KK5 TaxID=1855730 RepID=UPI00097BBB96|nr:2Fe-2S iron-sulfur cluster-binding protein [Pelomonas sp. KK5]
MDEFPVTVAPQGWSFACAADQTLLMAALDAGIQLPSSCRNGTCRSCIAKLLDGRIEHRIKWPGLSLEEKQEGWILPCVACPRSPVAIEAPQAIELFA